MVAGVGAVANEAAVGLAEPIGHGAGIGVLPQDVVAAVAVEVADLDRRPLRVDVIVGVGEIAREAAVGIAEPVGHLTIVASPQNIVAVVAIEIAHTDDVPSEGSIVVGESGIS